MRKQRIAMAVAAIFLPTIFAIAIRAAGLHSPGEGLYFGHDFVCGTDIDMVAASDAGPEPGLLCADLAQHHLSSQEGVRKGLQTFLTSEGSTAIAGRWATRQVQQGQPNAAMALKGKTSFDVLIDKWALGVQPEQNTISRTRMHTRRFEEMAGVRTVEEVTRRHAIRFIEQLQQAGQTPQNINMHLASLIKLLNYAVRLDLIKTNETSGLTSKLPAVRRQGGHSIFRRLRASSAVLFIQRGIVRREAVGKHRTGFCSWRSLRVPGWRSFASCTLTM